jgi:N-succinyldiaminopimelate aminotransferase
MLNPRLDQLTDFTFRRLARLLEPIDPPRGRRAIDLSIGSPMHPVPELLLATLVEHGALWNRYPPADGTPAFRRAVADWLDRRYALPPGMVDPNRHILPVAGTKEALYLIAQTVMREARDGQRPAVLMPNPFYNVYFGAAVMAGAEPVLLPVAPESHHLPDLERLPSELLARTAAFYLCSPANPQGSAASLGYLQRSLELARAYGFLLIADECYSEIFTDSPPPGALQAAAALGGDLGQLLVFNSLSKRSSAAGLRSGFVAGDPAVIAGFLRLRSYAAPVQSLPVLAAAAALWQDEEHVRVNRAWYQEKHDLAAAALVGRYGHFRPDGGFFLWLDVGDGEAVARRLWSEAAIKVLPGAYLGRPDAGGRNPGANYIRVALVQDPAITREALAGLVDTLG